MRSVYSKYTIPLYYEYDTAMTPDTLNDIIRTIQSYGYHVVGITADNATDNGKCAERLGVTNDFCGSNMIQYMLVDIYFICVSFKIS